MEILNFLQWLELISLSIGFFSWGVVGYFAWASRVGCLVRWSMIFAVVVSFARIIAVFIGTEMSIYFNVVWAMSAMHILGEKSAKVFLDFILQYRWVKK